MTEPKFEFSGKEELQQSVHLRNYKRQFVCGRLFCKNLFLVALRQS